MDSWKDFALLISGAIVSFLLAQIIRPLIGALAKSREERTKEKDSSIKEKLKASEEKVKILEKNYGVLDSLVTNLDKTLAVRLEKMSVLEGKLSTYFAKMDTALEQISRMQNEMAKVEGAAKIINEATVEYGRLIDTLKADALDTTKEVRQLLVTNKKREIILAKQITKLSDKVGIPFDFDPDLFLDIDNYKKMHSGG